MHTAVLGAVDAGSNAIRVVVAEVKGGVIRKLELERLEVRLGAGAFTRRRLDRDTMDAAVDAFKRCREMFDRHGVTAYRAVATSAVRDASNAEALRHRIMREAQIELSVIDGEEEARLVRAAVARTLGDACPPCIIDLGGGSLEINAKLPGEAKWRGVSLPVGTVRMLEMFGIGDKVSDAEAAMVRRYTVTSLKAALGSELPVLGAAAICGGNAEALTKIFGLAGALPSLTLHALEAALPDILGATVAERMARYQIRKDRADVLSMASLIFAVVGRQLGITEFISPGVGLRDAVLFELCDAVADEKVKAVEATDQALLTAARDFSHRMGHDIRHSEHVRELARSLFVQTRDLHQLDDSQLVLLEVAAILHDIGEVVHSRGHHKHSEYLIRTGRIAGLDGERRDIVAAIARCHRKTASDARKILAELPLLREGRAIARKLAGILRLADGLDYDHRQAVESLVVSKQRNVLTIDLFTTADARAFKPEEMLRKADLLADEFEVKLELLRAKVKKRTEPRAATPV
ncbi:MAG: Ppx/GppA family phosphatase [Myxococcales bacterium]|nr:Ppx/GppA family phosphatase [Myxococcales bacterium]